MASFFVINGARAQDTLPGGNFSELRDMGVATVRQVIDPYTVELEDGQIVRLTGVDYTDFGMEFSGAFSGTAMKILKDMLEGKSVYVYQTKDTGEGRTNRMDHALAHLVRQSDKAWVQGSLIALGLAYVHTPPSNPEMAGQMLALEDAARKNKLGIWSDDKPDPEQEGNEASNFKILTPDETKNYYGTYRIVEGKVVSAAIRDNRIYLNFGPDWRTDFTATIDPQDKKAFARQGLDPLSWNGRVIRVRGWLDSRNGISMRLDHPQVVELIDESSSPLHP